MRTVRLSILTLGALASCGGDRREAASPGQAADTVATAVDGSPPAPGTSASAASREEKPVLAVQVQEEAPGMLAQAKYHPLDAQHLAQAKFPTGKVQAGWLERRGENLVYRFRFRDEEGKLHDVLVDAFTGSIINTIPVQ